MLKKLLGRSVLGVVALTLASCGTAEEPVSVVNEVKIPTEAVSPFCDESSQFYHKALFAELNGKPSMLVPNRNLEELIKLTEEELEYLAESGELESMTVWATSAYAVIIGAKAESSSSSNNKKK